MKSPLEAPKVTFQPTEDRHDTQSAWTQNLPLRPPPEIQTTIIPPQDIPLPETYVEPRSPADNPGLVLKSSVKHLSTKFLETRCQPIGERTIMRIPASGTPLEQISVEILEAPTLHHEVSPIRFPDLRGYYPGESISGLDFQVIRIAASYPEIASIGTYIVFKSTSRKGLEVNRHFANSHVYGDAFIVKVAEKAHILWGTRTSNGQMRREVWNDGLAGVMFYHMPCTFLGREIPSSGHNSFFEGSQLVHEILSMGPVDHHDAITIDWHADDKKLIPVLAPKVHEKEEDTQKSVLFEPDPQTQTSTNTIGDSLQTLREKHSPASESIKSLNDVTDQSSSQTGSDTMTNAAIELINAPIFDLIQDTLAELRYYGNSANSALHTHQQKKSTSTSEKKNLSPIRTRARSEKLLSPGKVVKTQKLRKGGKGESEVLVRCTRTKRG